jgi:hypothetical protein
MPWRHDEQEEIPAPCWLITLHFAMQKQWDCSKTTPRCRKKISYIIERTRLFCVLKCSGGHTLFKLLLGVTVNKNKVAPTVLGKIIDQAFTYLHGSFVKSHHVFCQYVNGDECLSSFLPYLSVLFIRSPSSHFCSRFIRQPMIAPSRFNNVEKIDGIDMMRRPSGNQVWSQSI